MHADPSIADQTAPLALDAAPGSSSGGGTTSCQDDPGAGVDSSPLGVWCHETALVEPGVAIGRGAQIGPFAHVMGGATIGADCQIGRNVVIAPTAVVGDRVTLGPGVMVDDGVVLEEGVYCGPGVVFAPVVRLPNEHLGVSTGTPAVPSAASRSLPEKRPESSTRENAPDPLPHGEDGREPIRVGRGVTLEANATILGGSTIHAYAVVGAGSVVRGEVPRYALMSGVPAARTGWICRCRQHCFDVWPNIYASCPVCKRHYKHGGRLGPEEYSPREDRRRRRAKLLGQDRH
ncbi:MAG: hypothetical protein HQ582_11435 [Planctomycetes bacterium]|nr:hypothetical protein [Planctomycetota bacterium]